MEPDIEEGEILETISRNEESKKIEPSNKKATKIINDSSIREGYQVKRTKAYTG